MGKAQDILIPPDVDMRSLYRSSFTVKAGENVKLCLPLIGKPKPKVMWYQGEDDLAEELRQTKHINTAIDDDNNLIFNIRDAVRGDAGVFRVRVKNQAGDKTCKIRAVVLDRPAPPAGPLEYHDVQATSLLLNWRMPTEDGGSPTTNYVVLMKEREAESWRCIADTVVRTTLNVKKLKRGATYCS